MLPSARWRISPALGALALGIILGRPGLRLIDPQLLEEGGPLETACAVALLVSLFCAGLRLRTPFEWQRWRMPVRLGTLSLLAALALTTALAKAMYSVGMLGAALLAAVLAPTDAYLSAETALNVEGEAEPQSAFVLTAAGALSGGLALPCVMLVLGLMGLEYRGSDSPGWLMAATLWATGGGAVAGWLIGVGLARWIALLDLDRQTEFLEATVVFAAAALAFGGAEALHTSGYIAVLAAGLALCRGGRLHSSRARRAVAPGVLKMAARVERAACLAVIVLLGATSTEMDLGVKSLLFAMILIVLVRPLAVRVGLKARGMAGARVRPLEWTGVHGAASMYCLVYAIDHGLTAPFARQLAGVALLVMAGSIVVHGVSVTHVRKASPGAVSG